ncbi:MAG: sensor histidine kinase, partial [Candidatus Limnocylindrales bacterium]
VSIGTRLRKAWEALGADSVGFSVSDETGGWLVVADPDQLDQVLWALLDNAVKYGVGAPVEAVIRADEATSRVRLTIVDGGPGVSDGDRERLFTRFARGTTSDPDGGSGLGLYVSRELCRAMGGELEMETAVVGKGAAFAVTLPGEPGHDE